MAHEELDRFLGWRQVRDVIGLGRTTAWRLRQSGDFPEPVHLSPGRVAWRERDIAAWHASRGALPIPTDPPFKTRRRPADPPAIPPPPPAPLPSSEPTVQSRRRRRSGQAVLDGQLGFDF